MFLVGGHTSEHCLGSVAVRSYIIVIVGLSHSRHGGSASG